MRRRPRNCCLALQSGLTTEQVALIASGQSLLIANGEPLAKAGLAVGESATGPAICCSIVANYLQVGALLAEFRTGDGTEMVALAELACDVPEEIDDFPVLPQSGSAARQPMALARAAAGRSGRAVFAAACRSGGDVARCPNTGHRRREGPVSCCAPRSGAGCQRQDLVDLVDRVLDERYIAVEKPPVCDSSPGARP